MRGTTRKTTVRLRIMTVSALVLGIATFSGCKSTAQRRVATGPEPGLSEPVEPGATVVAAPVRPDPQVSFVDRHPLLSKPREYYEGSGNNKVVKVAAATVIGIPAGLFGELKQIVVGTPKPPRY